MSRWLRLLPVGLLLVLLAALVWRLAVPGDTVIRSAMVGRPLPALTLPAALPGKPGLSSDENVRGPYLINLFASWCVPCIAEAPQLAELARRGVAIDGIAVRDKPADLAAFLARHGDPFRRIGADGSSRAQLALGSAGVPETFVIDSRGVIRYQHVGPVEPGDISTIVEQLEAAR